MSSFKTPLVSKLRKDSATVYTFGSAVEDIGLNINEKNNKVRLTNYVLLNLPKIKYNGGSYGEITADKIIPSDVVNTLKGNDFFNDYIFPSMIQNYVLNFETRLRNQSTYDFSASQTVTEKTFWKWLQKTGALVLTEQTGPNGEIYYHENFANPDDMVIKGFGQITSSSQMSNTYNMNNETYIMIPSSYGQMKYYMSTEFDANYTKGSTYMAQTTHPECLEGYTTDEIYSEDTSIIYRAWADNDTHDYILDKDTDGLQFEFDINDIRKYIRHENGGSTGDLYYDRMTYDNIAIDSSMCLGQKYEFNTILLYYTIFDKGGNKLSTNLFGIMVLDSTTKISGNETWKEPLNITFSNEDVYSHYVGYSNTPSNYVVVEQTDEYPYATEKSVKVTITDSGSSSVVPVFSLYTNKELSHVNSISFSLLCERNDRMQFGIKYGISSSNKSYISTPLMITNFFERGAEGALEAKDENGNVTGTITVRPVYNENKQFYTITYTPSVEESTGESRYNNGYYSVELTLPNLESDTKKEYFACIGNLEFGFDGTGDPISGVVRDFLKIPSLLKKKTTSGSFGSEYSFRVNFQTASIYDKDSSLADYSTAEASTITDFSGAISNLKTAVDILKNNSLVVQKIYDDSRGMKQLVANSTDKVNELEKNVNDILHGNVRTVSADLVDSIRVKSKKIDASVSFTDENGNVFGYIDGSTLHYDKIDTSTMSMSDLSISNVTVGEGGMIIKNSEKNILRIDSNGNIYMLGTKQNLENSIGKWYIVDVSVMNENIINSVHELLVEKNVDELLDYVKEKTGVGIQSTGLNYEEYFKCFWKCLLGKYKEEKENNQSKFINRAVSPIKEKNCKVIKTNDTGNDTFTDSEMTFKEVVHFVGNEPYILVENLLTFIKYITRNVDGVISITPSPVHIKRTYEHTEDSLENYYTNKQKVLSLLSEESWRVTQ